MENTAYVDIPAFTARQRMGRFHIVLEVLCIINGIMDGLDLQIVGYVGPSISKDWSLPPGAMGTVFGVGLIGMMIGLIFLGMLGDRSGRKTIILSSITIFGVSTLLSATATSTGMLTFWRFCTGFGLGGVIPNTAVLLTEYMPKRFRATMFMLVSASVALGAALGGLLAAYIIPRGGWHWVFISSGIITLSLVPFYAWFVPESLRRLSLQPGQNARIGKILKRIDPTFDLPADARFIVDEPKPKGFPINELYRQGRALTTICLCGALFMNMMALYFLSNWLPTLINNLGFSIQSAVLATTCLQIGGIFGGLSVGILADRFPPTRVLAAAFVVATVFTGSIAFAGTEFALLVALSFVAGAGVNGAQVGSIYTASISYPTAIRSTGVGWAMGIGRLGAILGPVIGGILLGLGWSFKSLFILASIPLLAGTLAAFTLGHEGRRKLPLDYAAAPTTPEST